MHSEKDNARALMFWLATCFITTGSTLQFGIGAGLIAFGICAIVFVIHNSMAS